MWTRIGFLLLIAVAAAAPRLASAQSAPAGAQAAAHILDYVASDYPQTVRGGVVVDAGEYQEQQEFAAQVVTLLSQAGGDRSGGLNAVARDLAAAIAARHEGTEIATRARALRSDVIQAFGLVVVPAQVPDPARGAALYASNCASCHGAAGRADGPAARTLAQPPADFGDVARMRERSLYGLFNTISLGVGGTPMRAFGELSEADRWSLAYRVAAFALDDDQGARGEALWKKDVGRAEFADGRLLATATPNELAARSGDLDAVRAFLVRHPEALAATAPSPIALARSQLAAAARAYRGGDPNAARALAISAYLEGFELIESALDNVDAPLRVDVERQMMALRGAIDHGEPATSIDAQVGAIDAALARANERLGAGALSPTAAFVSAALILLREGLEAILVLAAIFAFTIKTGRRDATPWLHAGWIAALVAGAATWFVAHQLVSISGASRELTEGVTALIAAAMLLSVGYWLHDKSNARAWQAFVRDHVGTALARPTLWAMAGISFLAVYRELFEIILFYETLWLQAGPGARGAVLGGIGAAAVVLALAGGAILRFGVRLPIGPFFTATSALLALLAFVFVGDGIAALQEAGTLASTAVRFIDVPWLGIHPTVEGLLAQGATLALVVGGAWRSRRARPDVGAAAARR